MAYNTTWLEFELADLDKYNYRSEVRHLSREYRSGELETERRIHEYIAFYANELLHDHIATECKVTTTLHNEKVILTTPTQRSPAREYSFIITLREDLHYAPDNKRLYSNDFRDHIARYIFDVATDAIKYADATQTEEMLLLEEPSTQKTTTP